ncbi:MAG TPA: lipocalin-like domain-containing protein [Burkholderiales bacterium]|nr:lipocalin-like domain-containing protein [Burkholderiales bacterium]
MNATRRRILAWLASAAPAAMAGAHAAAPSSAPRYAAVMPGYRMRFPHDEGSHPAFRTEWWYVTGWLDAAKRDPLGFQITFFRAHGEVDHRNPSAFTAREIVIAHAALSDRTRGRLLHDQKIARAALGLAGAEQGRTRVWIDDWALVQQPKGYRATIAGAQLGLDLTLTATQPPLLQGDDGFSRKGPRPESASYYYSIPHLRVSGAIVQSQARSNVSGLAWLDHEWSSSYMDERASGWDWIGVNLDDGGALMLFQMRERRGGRFWAGGAHRARDGERRVFSPREITFTPTRTWRSPRTGTEYPVAWRAAVAGLDLTIEPLFEDQEHDTRASVGTIYWEGAVTALARGKRVGRGYLELTGYWRPMRL